MRLDAASRLAVLFSRSFFTKAKKNQPDPAIQALDEIKTLMSKGEFKQAYHKLEEADEKYPGLCKAVPFYRGKILSALDKQSGSNEFISEGVSKGKNTNDVELK